MTSNVDHNSIYVCTLRDIIVMLIHAISGIDNLVINSLTFNMIRNILMDIFMNNDRDHALMILVSLKRIVYKWLLEEGLGVGYDDCINKVGLVTIPNVN